MYKSFYKTSMPCEAVLYSEFRAAPLHAMPNDDP